MVNNNALFDRDLFFKLPIVDDIQPYLAILVSRYQPTGFFDDKGTCWCAVLGDKGEMMRQRMN